MIRIQTLLITAVFCAFCTAIFCASSMPSLAAPAVEGTPRLAQGHPCTLWDNRDVAAYKTSFTTNPSLKAAFVELQDWGNTRVAEPLNVPAHEMETDGTWTFPAFKRGYQDASGKWNWEWDFNTSLQQCTEDVSNLGMLYALTGDTKYAAFAGQILLALADAYGYGKGNTVPNPHGYDHFEAYGFDGGDDGMFLAKACQGYDLIYNSLTAEERTHIESGLIHPLAEHLKTFDFMYTDHGRWGLVCLYGLFIAGETLNDQAMVDLALYGPGGTESTVTGGFMDCFKPSCLRDGVIWGADAKIEDQMASVCILTTIAQVMWHQGVDLYDYQDKALKKSYDAALASAGGDLSILLALPGVDAFQYAYHRYQDPRYLPVVARLKPEFTLAIGEHLPPPPVAVPAKLPAVQPVRGAETAGVPASRLAKLSRGTNVTQWFQVYSPVDAAHYQNYMSDAEMAMIYRLGLRHVRLCISPDYLYDPKAPGTLPEAHLATLESAIRRFNHQKLAVIVDMHNTDKQNSEGDPQWVAGYPTFWGTLAARLNHFDPGMVFFEILNEPVFQGRESDWFTLQDNCIATIRKSAPNFTIIVTGPDWGGIDGLLKLSPVADRDVVYSFHFYDPFTFTHQGATWAGPIPPLLKGIPYPSSPEAVAVPLSNISDPVAQSWVRDYGTQRWNKTKLKSRLAGALDWGRNNGVALYCGEFGVYPIVAPPDSRERWFRDYASVLKESSVGWAVWGWDDGFGFGRQYIDGKPVIDPVPVDALGLNKIK
jgi:endoglucanase